MWYVPVTTLHFLEVLVPDTAFLTFSQSMESRLPLQRSFPSHQSLDDSFEDPSLSSRHREPLADSDSAGNAQQAIDSNNRPHHDSKAIRPQVDRPPASYIVPSQPSRQPLGNTLALRKQSHRRQRRDRFDTQNPIISSPQYLAYRSRQTREGQNDDAKWPDQLEMAFLDGKYHFHSVFNRV